MYVSTLATPRRSCQKTISTYRVHIQPSSSFALEPPPSPPPFSSLPYFLRSSRTHSQNSFPNSVGHGIMSAASSAETDSNVKKLLYSDVTTIVNKRSYLTICENANPYQVVLDATGQEQTHVSKQLAMERRTLHDQLSHIFQPYRKVLASRCREGAYLFQNDLYLGDSSFCA